MQLSTGQDRKESTTWSQVNILPLVFFLQGQHALKGWPDHVRHRLSLAPLEHWQCWQEALTRLLKLEITDAVNHMSNHGVSVQVAKEGCCILVLPNLLVGQISALPMSKRALAAFTQLT